MVNLPSFYSYGNYNSDNYGAHSLCFTVKGSDQDNYWGQPTGKHLNIIQPDHSKRVNEKEFHKLLAKV